MTGCGDKQSWRVDAMFLQESGYPNGCVSIAMYQPGQNVRSNSSCGGHALSHTTTHRVHLKFATQNMQVLNYIENTLVLKESFHAGMKLDDFTFFSSDLAGFYFHIR
jgi:hypothetical protein